MSHMCESIGHQPLQGRCPAPSLNIKQNLLRQGTDTADHQTLFPLLKHYSTTLATNRAMFAKGHHMDPMTEVVYLRSIRVYGATNAMTHG